jgi:hypothetical protein
MLTKNDVVLSAVSCKKDTIFGVHPKQTFGPSYFVTALVFSISFKARKRYYTKQDRKRNQQGIAVIKAGLSCNKGQL